jgi:flagellar basal body rod protein FlgB
MIETGIDELMNRAVPLYQDVQVIKNDGNYVVIGDEKRKLIDLIVRREIHDNFCKYLAKQIENTIKP